MIDSLYSCITYYSMISSASSLKILTSTLRAGYYCFILGSLLLVKSTGSWCPCKFDFCLVRLIFMGFVGK